MSLSDSTQRFSDRVADYVRYRPDYPPALTHWLHTTQGVAPSWKVADIGAGTGISTKLFLDAGHPVMAVEPNEPMRAAARAWLGDRLGLTLMDGSAEATGLAAGSVDLVSAAQAFHWFDPVAVRREWNRILKPEGLAVIFWNTRRLTGTTFLAGYEALLRDYGTDYAAVAESYPDDETMRAWFGTGFRGQASFEHAKRLDYSAVRGRLLSSSYAPKAGHPRHEPMLAKLRALFDANAVEGAVDFIYDTRVFAGWVCAVE